MWVYGLAQCYFVYFFFFLSLHVIGFRLFQFVLVVLVCFSMFNDRALSLCTDIFAPGNIMIW